MNTMKKAGLILLCALLWTGCANGQEESASENTVPMTGDAYTLFTQDYSAMKPADSASYGVKCEYKFKFSDDTLSLYSMDGVLQSDEAGQKAHLTQHIAANGLNSSMESYFYDGTLYNVYNGISYYEKMSFDNVKELMLVPLKPYQFPEQLIKTSTAVQDAEGNHIYTFILNEESRKDYFADHYDFYGVTQFDQADVQQGIVTDTFSQDGTWIGEKAEFTASFLYQEQEIEAVYTSEVSLFSLNETEIAIDDERKAEHASYVAAADIDTSQIADDTGYDDAPEDTVIATFRKRLINRLGYSEIEGDAVQMIYNTNEAYTIDFANRTFIYSNYSINYVYSWQGDLISMGTCTYDFGKDYATNACQDSTLEKMKDVKKYLMMELYYCGLSLEELQSENS